MSRKVNITAQIEVDIIIDIEEGEDIQQALQSLDYDITGGQDTNFDIVDVQDVRIAGFEVTDSR